ncbi:MAG: hypothetical protein WBW16_15240 [Bacteroidota bacterium]
MPESSLAKKMRLKPSQRIAVINAPKGYMKELSPLPSGVNLVEQLQGKFDWVQVFVQNKAQLEKLAPRVVRALKPESLLWISFPKGTSKIQTDLTRDKGWNTLRRADLKWITLISVNETWSAFSMRPFKPGEKRESFR